MMENLNYIEFIDLKSKKSGSAAILCYTEESSQHLMLIDGGFDSTSDILIEHINKYYGKDIVFDHVVVTHNDKDHSGGICNILDEYKVNNIWMLRPWIFAEEIIDRFKNYKNVDNLKDKLKESYSNLLKIEEKADDLGIKINEAFAGSKIGISSVISPTKEFFLDLVVESDKTPEEKNQQTGIIESISKIGKAIIKYIKSLWGEENFKEEGTTAENEMSIVQFVNMPMDKRYLLTGDVGCRGLSISIDYLIENFGSIPKIELFEVPHHGSRRNLSSEILDILFGERYKSKDERKRKFTAVIQATKDDDDHPSNVTIRALYHRGGDVYVVDNGSWLTIGDNKPKRDGEVSATPREYPEEQESD